MGLGGLGKSHCFAAEWLLAQTRLWQPAEAGRTQPFLFNSSRSQVLSASLSHRDGFRPVGFVFLHEVELSVFIFLSIGKLLKGLQVVHNLGPEPVEKQTWNKSTLVLADHILDFNLAVPYRSKLQAIAHLCNTEATRIGRDCIWGRGHRHENRLRARVLVKVFLYHELPRLEGGTIQSKVVILELVADAIQGTRGRATNVIAHRWIPHHVHEPGYCRVNSCNALYLPQFRTRLLQRINLHSILFAMKFPLIRS